MTNRKTTRRALVLSLLSLLLCCSMLVGTTFAWFTDSVTSGKNQIVAGNLDVELYYQVEGQSDWTKVTKETNVFKTGTLWEPGHTEVVKLKVVNEGTLALKYQLGVNIASETGSKNVLGNEFKLSDHIKFGVVEGAQSYTREQAIAAVDATATALNVAYGTGTVKLDPKTQTNTDNEDIVTMVVYMPTSVGNEANFAKGEKEPTILLGLNLYATQVEAEEDSFNNKYDQGAWGEGFQVYNANDLQTAINAGETNITVMDDITTETPIVIPAAASTYSLRASGIYINLNGKFLSATTGNAVINNGTLEIVNGAIKSVDAYTITNNGALTVDDVQITNGINSNAGSVTINSGKIETVRGGYSHAVRHVGEGPLVINGGEFTGNGNEVIQSESSPATINGGTFKKVEKTSYLIGGRNMVINGGTFYAYESDPAAHPVRSDVVIKGGTYNYNPTNVASGYKAVQTDDGWMVVADTTNYVTTSDEFVTAINSAADGSTILVAAGEYALRFTNNTAFNVDSLTIQGMGEVKLAITSSEVHYGRIQGDNVTFENIHFTDSTVGATGKATYNKCTFDGRLEMASSGGKETYANGCTMKNVHTSSDMGAGNGYFTGCAMELAEYGNTSYNPTLTFTGCTIGTLKPWNVNTELVNTTVETMDLSAVTSATVTIDGVSAVGTNDGLKAAIANGSLEILLMDGEYDLNGNQKDGLVLTGVGTAVNVANTTNYAGGKSVGAIWQAITLENVTITNTVYTMADGGASTFKKVNFAAGFRQGYGKGVTFEECTFGSNSEGYALHFQTDSASEGGIIKLNGCEFGDGNVHLGGTRTYEFTGCEFAEGTDFQVWSNITLDGCTVNGEEVTAANAATLFPNLNLDKVTIK